MRSQSTACHHSPSRTLARATELAGEKRVALLCYEAEACGCHRKIVADRIRESLACEVVDL